MNTAIYCSEVLSALGWYFESKNLALKNALKFRSPLTVEQQRDMRQYYSQYFTSLVSATELLLEKKYPYNSVFKKSLENAFVFDALPEYKNNYSYIRELRNSIIHRGLDICSSAHVCSDFIWIVAPSPVTNKDGNKPFQAFGYYLLDIISKCESIIGPLIVRHLNEVGLLKPAFTQEQSVVGVTKLLCESNVIPPWAKQLALEKVNKIDHVDVQIAEVRRLIEILNANPLAAPLPNNSLQG